MIEMITSLWDKYEAWGANYFVPYTIINIVAIVALASLAVFLLLLILALLFITIYKLSDKVVALNMKATDAFNNWYADKKVTCNPWGFVIRVAIGVFGILLPIYGWFTLPDFFNKEIIIGLTVVQIAGIGILVVTLVRYLIKSGSKFFHVIFSKIIKIILDVITVPFAVVSSVFFIFVKNRKRPKKAKAEAKEEENEAAPTEVPTQAPVLVDPKAVIDETKTEAADPAADYEANFAFNPATAPEGPAEFKPEPVVSAEPEAVQTEETSYESPFGEVETPETPAEVADEPVPEAPEAPKADDVL